MTVTEKLVIALCVASILEGFWLAVLAGKIEVLNRTLKERK